MFLAMKTLERDDFLHDFEQLGLPGCSKVKYFCLAVWPYAGFGGNVKTVRFYSDPEKPGSDTMWHLAIYDKI